MVLLLGLVLAVLTGCSGPKAGPVTALQQLNAPSMRIGVVSDTNDDEIVARKLPRATVEYVKDSISGYVAVSQGKLTGRFCICRGRDQHSDPETEPANAVRVMFRE